VLPKVARNILIHMALDHTYHFAECGLEDAEAVMDNGPRLIRIRGVVRKEARRLAARLAVQVANRAALATVHGQMYGLVIP
jgi:hypothetical protein